MPFSSLYVVHRWWPTIGPIHLAGEYCGSSEHSNYLVGRGTKRIQDQACSHVGAVVSRHPSASAMLIPPEHKSVPCQTLRLAYATIQKTLHPVFAVDHVKLPLVSCSFGAVAARPEIADVKSQSRCASHAYLAVPRRDSRQLHTVHPVFNGSCSVQWVEPHDDFRL